MEYKNKYLKYKTKYLELQKMIGSGKQEDLVEFEVAILNNDTEKVRTTIETIREYINYNIYRSDNKTPLIIAIEKNNKDIVKILLENNVDVEKVVDGDTPLIYAIKNNNKDIVELLLGKNANVNKLDRFGNTPLIIAIENNYEDIVKLLLEKDANVNKPDSSGYTPLMNAIKHKRDEKIIDLLLKYDYITLMIAIENNNKDYVNLLLNKGADVNKKDISDNTPLMIAFEYKHKHKDDDTNEKIIELLLRNDKIDISNLFTNITDITYEELLLDITYIINTFEKIIDENNKDTQKIGYNNILKEKIKKLKEKKINILKEIKKREKKGKKSEDEKRTRDKREEKEIEKERKINREKERRKAKEEEAKERKKQSDRINTFGHFHAVTHQ
jgi:ankyrin repeat protein